MHEHPPVAISRRRWLIPFEAHPGRGVPIGGQAGDAARSEAFAQAHPGSALAEVVEGGEGGQAGHQHEQGQGHRQGTHEHLQAAAQQQPPVGSLARLQGQQAGQGQEHRQPLEQAGPQIGLQRPQNPGAHQLQQAHQPPFRQAFRLEQLQARQQRETDRHPAEHQGGLEPQQAHDQQCLRQPLQTARLGAGGFGCNRWAPLADAAGGGGGAVHHSDRGARARASRHRSRWPGPWPGGMVEGPSTRP